MEAGVQGPGAMTAYLLSHQIIGYLVLSPDIRQALYPSVCDSRGKILPNDALKLQNHIASDFQAFCAACLLDNKRKPRVLCFKLEVNKCQRKSLE